MAKKTYRKFSKKGLSKKNKLRKSKRKSLRSKRKSRKHGGYDGSAEEASSGPTLLPRGDYWGNKSCGTKRGEIGDIICQSKKVKAYSESDGEEHRLKNHKEKLAKSIKKYIEEKYKPISITSYVIVTELIPQLQEIDNLDETGFNTIISTIPSVRERVNEFNEYGHF